MSRSFILVLSTAPNTCSRGTVASGRFQSRRPSRTIFRSCSNGRSLGMATGQYTTLAEALGAVPDPRQRRGQRYTWSLLLTIIAAAVVSGQRHGRAISQWVHEHVDELEAVLAEAGGR